MTTKSTISENNLIEIIKKDPFVIKMIDNPSPQAQIAAVMTEYEAIESIENPCEAAQIIAVMRSSVTGISILNKIKNPCEAAKMIAVYQDASRVSYIENPSEMVQIIAAVGYYQDFDNKFCETAKFISEFS